MDINTLFIALVGNTPAVISTFLSIIAIGFAIYLNSRKINLEDRTTESAVYEKQVKLLLEQVESLSDDLNAAREQLTAIHNQNIQLMSQLRDANQRIGELENLLSQTRIH